MITMVVDDQSEISFQSLKKGRHHGNQVSCTDVAGRRQLVVQPGRLTLHFALHLLVV